MLQLLVTAPKRGFLLVIGAYRDNEVEPTHPLVGANGDLRRAGTNIAEIKLQPLAASSKRVGRTMSCSMSPASLKWPREPMPSPRPRSADEFSQACRRGHPGKTTTKPSSSCGGAPGDRWP